ncbi:hypothetical protein JCM10207_009269 [Rhodosporidiobolus poonsookiae]
MSSQPIVCGVNCACAAPSSTSGLISNPTDPTAAVPLPKRAVTGQCTARESCKYAQEGGCACGGGDCDCAAGTCQAAESARAKCSVKQQEGGCSCAPGQCEAAGFSA